MSQEVALNFDQWKTCFGNYKPMKVWLWPVLQIYRELLSLAAFLWFHSNSKVASYLYWQNSYPNFKTTCHIKLKFFLWTKFQESLLLAEYLISVNATLRTCKNIQPFCKAFIKLLRLNFCNKVFIKLLWTCCRAFMKLLICSKNTDESLDEPRRV